jgi:hypothetical protein
MRFAGYYNRYLAGALEAVFDRLFMTYCTCWLVIHIGRWCCRPVRILNNWLTDLVFIPTVAHVALMFTRRYIVCNAAYRYPLSYLLFAALYVSLIYEWVFPHCHFHTVGDPIDVIAYFAGSLFYFFVHQGPVELWMGAKRIKNGPRMRGR